MYSKIIRYILLLSIFLVARLSFAEPIALDRNPDKVVSVVLPEIQYEKPNYIPVSGPWTLVGSAKGIRIWESPLPVRPRSLFFHRPPKGMTVLRKESQEEWDAATTLRFSARLTSQGLASLENKWAYSASSMQVSRSIAEGRPQEGEYAVQYPKAISRDRVLQDTTLVDGKQFVIRQQQVGDHTKHGLFLPTGTTITYALTVPENSVFETTGQILPPEAADPVRASDGATLKLSVYAETNQLLVEKEIRLSLTEENIRIDFAEFAGQTIRFVLETIDQNPELDYAFLHDPIIRERQEAPKRVVWVFIDTLRKDHLSIYGYDRQTTPKLDRWAKENAGIYSQARSIAPWTLPSSRTMVTGFQPEKWGSVPTIQDKLSSKGWYTSFLAGNIYLSSNFEGHTDWTSHRCINWPIAEVQVERAQRELEAHPDRDVFLMLHIMDMHLPYTEPLPYRYKFAGKSPEIFPGYSFSRSEVMRAKRKLSVEDKQYVIDRYDNNLAYIDDVLTPFLESLPDDSIIAIFSDHGEEFWDHQGFEHGHTLYDELLNVPFIIKGKGIPKGMQDGPVSLLDLMPTTLKALDIEIDPTQGVALQEYSERQLNERPQAFGRLLYGTDGWGSLHRNIKYISRNGEEHLFDLQASADEQTELSRSESQLMLSQNALSEALERETALGFRITVRQPKGERKDATVIIQIPEGLKEAWRGSDPTKRTPLTIDKTDDTVVFTWSEKSSGSREAFFVPKGDPRTSFEQFQMDLMVDGTKVPFTATEVSQTPEYVGKKITLAKARLNGYSAYISYMYLPIPSEEDLELDAFDDEVSEELKILGYME